MASRGERKSDVPAAHADAALVGSIHAGKHVHERALAGPVLAQQGMDLAGADVEVHVVVGEHAQGTP